MATQERATSSGVVKSKNGNCASSKSAVKTLLSLARQDNRIASRQNLLQTFLQIGATLSEIQKIYEFYPQALTRDVLFEAGKLGVPQKILEFLTRKLVEAYLRPDGRPFPYYALPSHLKYPGDFRCSGDFRLEKDAHLLTSGNVARGLQQILHSNVVNLQAFAPVVGKKSKPFWNIRDFLDFLGELPKSQFLETLQFTFPRECTVAKRAPTSIDAAAKAGIFTSNQTQQSSENQLIQVLKSPSMPTQIKNKLSRKRLDGCLRLRYVRIDFDHSPQTSASLVQMVSCLGNLPSLQMFFTKVKANGIIQTKKKPQPEHFTEFIAELLGAIGKLINSSMSLQSLVIDAKDCKEESDWEPLLRALEKNPPLKRLLIRGFSLPTEKATKALSRQYNKDDVSHANLEPFKRNLLRVVKHHNSSLSDVRFVIPKCRCDRMWDQLLKNDCPFDYMNDEINLARMTCVPVTRDDTKGKRIIPPPFHVPELAHVLSLNFHGQSNISASDMTHHQFIKVLTKDGKFLDNDSVLYSLLRKRAEFIPVLYSNVLGSPSYVDSEEDELYLAAAGRLSLPLERFVELCLRRRDRFSSLYDFLRLFPTVWLDHLRTTKQIIREQTKGTRKAYVSVVELAERTRIVKTGVKNVTKDDETKKLVVYGKQSVLTFCGKTSKKEPPKPLKLIRLNVAPSVGGATLTRFPKLGIGAKGQLVFLKKKKRENDNANYRSAHDDATGEAGSGTITTHQKRGMLEDTSNHTKNCLSKGKRRSSSSPKKKKRKVSVKQTKIEQKPSREAVAPNLNTEKPKNKSSFKAKDIKKIGLEHLKIEGLDDESSFEDFGRVLCPHNDAKKPVRRNSRDDARRKVRPTKMRSRSQYNLTELIGEASDDDESIDLKDDGSDWSEGLDEDSNSISGDESE